MGESKKHIGQILHETYRIERLIGKGGMGAVYEASHLRLPRRFAVKLLFADVGEDGVAVERFQHEAMVTSKLGHPNIVEVVDFHHTDEGEPYIVMELLEGEDLSKRLRRVKRFTLDEATAVLEQAASALQAAHDEGIIHRDLKPQNIFLCDTKKQQDLVKVVDFGIAKMLGSHNIMTKTKGIIGTPWYMSPERVKGETEQVDHRADIFSMGAMMYEMLTGQPPFTGEAQAVLFQIVYKDPAPLRSLRPDVPEDVEQAITRALAKEPGDRYSSMEAFAQEMVVEEYSGPIEEVDTSPHQLVIDDPGEQTVIDSSIQARLLEGKQTGPGKQAPTRRGPQGRPAAIMAQVPGLQKEPTNVVAIEDLTTEAVSEEEAENEPGPEEQKKRTTLTSGIGEVKDPQKPGKGKIVALAAGLAAILALAAGGIILGMGEDEAPARIGASASLAPEKQSPLKQKRPTVPPPAKEKAPAARTDSGVVVVVVPADPGTGAKPLPVEAPVPEPKVGVAPQPKSRPTVTPLPKKKPRRRGFGAVRVGTVSKGELISADIYLDGKPRGESPLVLQKVTAGRHVIVAKSKGFRTARRAVHVKPGKALPLMLKLSPVP